MAQVLPKELRLNTPPTMPQGRSYLFKQQATQSSYDGSAPIQINIPRLQRSYLTKDSYLKFRLSTTVVAGATSDNKLVLDGMGAFGLIDKIEVYDYLGSTLIESTSGHGQLMGALMDTHINKLEQLNHYSIGCGTTVISSATTNLTIANQGYGQIVNACTSSQSTTERYEFAIPLLSFLGLLSPKYVPLHNGWTIVITLNSLATAFGNAKVADGTATATTTSTSFTISDVYYCAQVLELGPIAEAMLLSSAGDNNPLVVHAKSYRNYIGTMSEGVRNYRLDLNLNVASLTNILWFMRPTANLGNITKKSLSARPRNYLQSWYFQYGSSILPQTSGIQCRKSTAYALTDGGGAEAYLEMMKSRHCLNQSNHPTGLLSHEYHMDSGSIAEYGLTAHSTARFTPRFLAGLDLELVSGKSNNLVCGLNTNGMLTSLFLTFDPDEPSTNIVSSRIDCFCEYDSFISVLPGVASTVSF